MTILIVDDNSQMRAFIRKILSGPGQQIFEAENGEAGIEAFKLNHPDIVCMDISMPGIDGIEATKRIRQYSPATKIIMVTDYDNKLLRLKAQDAGADEYVLKENLHALREMIKN